MSNAVRSEAVARSSDGQNASRKRSAPRQAASLKQAPRESEADVEGYSLNTLLLMLAFFFVLCVVAGLSVTTDRFGDPVLPRILR